MPKNVPNKKPRQKRNGLLWFTCGRLGWDSLDIWSLVRPFSNPDLIPSTGLQDLSVVS